MCFKPIRSLHSSARQTFRYASLFPRYFIRSAHKFSAPRTRVAPYFHSALSSHIRGAFRPDFPCAPQLCSFNLQLLPPRFGSKRSTHAKQFASFHAVATLVFPPRSNFGMLYFSLQLVYPGIPLNPVRVFY